MTTVANLLKHARIELAEFEEATLEAEVLLCFCLNKTRTWLHTWPDKEISDTESLHFSKLVAQRIQGKPIAYITGTRDFWTFSLKVSDATLIPRADTETLVQAALDLIPQIVDWRIVDLGTGTGAIALAIASERPECEVTGSDISAAALEIAQDNLDRYQLKNLKLIQSSWLENITGTFNLILSNPPYIAEDDPHLNAGDLPWEPINALRAEKNGLADIETIMHQAYAQLKPGGWLLLEHGWQQKEAICELFHQLKYTNIQTIKDLAGLDRVSLAQKPTE